MRDGDENLTGGFLSDEDVQSLIENQKAVCLEVDDDQKNKTKEPINLKPNKSGDEWSDWAVDLSLGNEVFLSSEEEIRILDEHESVSIDPGEFALLITQEIVDIPSDKVAFISLKFRHALKGLINISGFHVDPNFEGRIVFSVYNAGPSPAHLRQGESVFMIVFANLTRPVEGNRDEAKFEGDRQLKSDMIAGLQGRTTSLENLDDTVSQLQNRVGVLFAVLIGLVVTLLGIIATQAFL